MSDAGLGKEKAECKEGVDRDAPAQPFTRSKKPRPSDGVDRAIEAANAKAFSAIIRTPRDEADLREIVALLKASEWLPERPVPRAPSFPPGAPTKTRLESIQKYISSLEYNHTGTDYFSVRKNRGMKRICMTAREIIREALPIKCVEAVFLGAYMTAGMKQLTRIPVRLHSRVDGFSFRHIVLAIRIGNGPTTQWGALGLSRQATLMYKPFVYSSLSALISNYNQMYQAIGHCVQHVGVGLPLPHDVFSIEPIHWRPLALHPEDIGWPIVCRVVDSFTSKIEAVAAHVYATGVLPEEFLPHANSKYTPKRQDEDNTTGAPSKSKGDSKARTCSHRKRTADKAVVGAPRVDVESKSQSSPPGQRKHTTATNVDANEARTQSNNAGASTSCKVASDKDIAYNVANPGVKKASSQESKQPETGVESKDEGDSINHADDDDDDDEEEEEKVEESKNSVSIRQDVAFLSV